MWAAWLTLAVSAGAGVVPAAPSPVPSARGMCVVTDPRLTEISGMVRTRTGFVVVDDGSDLSSHWRIFFLDGRCSVTRAVRYPSTPRDTEDLVQAPDGTLWVADIGDNNRNRQTVALWRLGPGDRAPVLYRMRYPDGAHDAEALVLAGDGTPVIVTKDIGTALLYQPDAALRAGATVPLRRVGSWDIPGSSTSNPFWFAGHMVVTGGATTPDGSRVVLRTYADAYEFPVSGGDVVRAITTGTPRVVPLPDEPQGESVAYDLDGVSLLTVSEKATAADPAILRYPRTAPPSPGVSARASAPPAGTAAARSSSTVVTAVGVAGVAGLGMLAVGAVAIALRRRRGPRRP